MRKSTTENSESMKKTFKNNGRFNTEFGESQMEDYTRGTREFDKDENDTEVDGL